MDNVAHNQRKISAAADAIKRLHSDIAAPRQRGESDTSYRYQEIHRVAAEMYEKNPHWVAFFREILGVDGVVRRLIGSDTTQVQLFEQSTEHADIQRMLADLRRRRRNESQSDEERTKVITIRIPESVHEWLTDQAEGARVSMNKLCISKLLKALGDL